MTKKDKAQKVFKILRKYYPDARCTLQYLTPEEFLISNILSPQCTDTVVNAVTGKLWKKFGNITNLSKTKIPVIEKIIRPCGLFHNKAKSISKSTKLLVEKYNGRLPNTLSELTKFPGIGRKTALVILTEAFGVIEGIIIDTHNIRIAKRIGLSKKKDAFEIEKDLMKILPRDKWRMWSHLMVFHGRKLCTSRSPKCSCCPIRDLCNYALFL